MNMMIFEQDLTFLNISLSPCAARVGLKYCTIDADIA